MHTRIEEITDKVPVKGIMEEAPKTSRLKSRKPFYQSKQNSFRMGDEWTATWNKAVPRGGNIIEDPTKRMPGFTCHSRKLWVTSNRLLTGHGRTAANMHRWNLRETDACRHCQGGPETTDHIVLHCPVTCLAGGYETILTAGEEFKEWTNELRIEV